MGSNDDHLIFLSSHCLVSGSDCPGDGDNCLCSGLKRCTCVYGYLGPLCQGESSSYPFSVGFGLGVSSSSSLHASSSQAQLILLLLLLLRIIYTGSCLCSPPGQAQLPVNLQGSTYKQQPATEFSS